ncbi:MAG: protein kinase [Scytonema sp. RU_4_4]|nr:protein kinase [Scytonema sp. RU_4_4]
MRCLNCRLDGISQSTEICPRCGVHLPTLLRDVLTPETLLRGGDYRLDYALGRGGFGITYRAAHTSLEKLVAIKEFYPQEQAHREGKTGRLTVPTSQEESYQRGLQRFETEGRILAKLNHLNVVQVIDLFKERGTAYLVMELLSGNTLKDELDSQPGKNLPVERVKTVMTALVDALTVVHQQGIYHLDLKPDNVMVTPEGRIVLVDFGASRQNLGTKSGSRQSSRAFTETYAAPELIAGAKVGAESDLFELGMMLHEMLTGKLPPSALNRVFNDNWIPQNLDEPWQGMITAALQIKPENRPKSVQGWWEIGLRFLKEQRRREEERKHREAEERARREAEEEQRRQEAERQRQEAKVSEQQRQREQEERQRREAEARRARREAEESKKQRKQREKEEYANKLQRYKQYFLGVPGVFGVLGVLAVFLIFTAHLNPNDANAYYNRGNDHYSSGDNKAAIEDYNQAIRLNPNFATAYYNRGLARYNLGDNKAAIEDYQKAAELYQQQGNNDYYQDALKRIRELQR